MGQPTDRPLAEQQREEILHAAMACLTELGYESASIDTIARRAALPDSIVRQHFADKSEIRSALIALWSERLSAWIGSA
jgi:AcrR family transcriptional regulator